MKDFLKSISNSGNLFLTHLESCGIETINTFIHSRSFLENHTRFQTKIHSFFFYKNILYKNIEAQICDILRIF